MSVKKSYGLNPDTEGALICRLMADPSLLPRLIRHFRPDGLEVREGQLLAGQVVAFYRKFSAVPTPVMLMQELREQVNGGKLTLADLQGCAAWLEAARSRPQADSTYLLDKLLAREREEALWEALEHSTDLHAKRQFDQILPLIERANAIGAVASDLGVEARGNLPDRTRHRTENRQPRRWGTGIPELDDLLRGGISHDNPLGCFQGGPKSGKSIALLGVALHTVAMGGQVAYATLENGLQETLARMDAAVAGVPMDQLHSQAQAVHDLVDTWYAGVPGGVYVKKFPQKTTRPRDLLAWIDQLRLEKNFAVTHLIVDYADEMTSDQEGRYEKEWAIQGDVFRTLRTFQDQRGVLVWTATQLKQDALDKKMAGIGDAGGSIAKIQLVDVMITIGRTEEERNDELVRFGIAASRFCADATETAQLTSAYGMGRIVVPFLQGSV